MLSRLLLLIVVAAAAYSLVKSLSRRFSLNQKQFNLLFVLMTGLMIIIGLVVLGRLPIHFILAPLGVAATFLVRMLPTLLRFMPLWQMFKSRTQTSARKDSGQVSKINTRYLAVELDHDSGELRGEILQGEFASQTLAALSLEQLLQFRVEVQQDGDSLQVLEAFLDRSFPEWRDSRQESNGSSQSDRVLDESEMTRELALEILGLSDPVSREEVVKTHRQMMQKLHPDRGGSDYLAKKINGAKECLLESL